MADLQAVLAAIDELSPAELDTVYKYVVQRRQPGYWLVPGERLKEIREIMKPVYEQTAHMTEEEINAIIDEAIAEVRSERKAQANRRD